MITIYTIAYNEEIFIQFMIDHYRKRFKNCHIVVYDNMSTDNTTKIAKENNCEVIQFDTNNTINDSKYLEIKNNCWKLASTDWVLICDVDELLDINEENLLNEQKNNISIIQSEGWNMINMKDDFDLENIKYGSRCQPYDKYYLFNKNYISNINYSIGCHKASPIGSIKLSNIKYKLYHYKCINPFYHVERYKNYYQRLSAENKKFGWGNHYNQSEQDILNGYIVWRDAAIKIID